jgi:hypothetical protein
MSDLKLRDGILAVEMSALIGANIGTRDSTAVRDQCLRWVNRVGLMLRRHFRSTPINGHRQTGPVGPVRAMSGSERTYSITSSARASNVGGTVRPRALAVLRLMMSSY